MCLTSEVGIPSYHLTHIGEQVNTSYFLSIGPKPALAPFLYGQLFAVAMSTESTRWQALPENRHTEHPVVLHFTVYYASRFLQML